MDEFDINPKNYGLNIGATLPITTPSFKILLSKDILESVSQRVHFAAFERLPKVLWK
jgi:hypothetical protein